MKVAFALTQFDEQWLGGVNYFRSLLYALTRVPGRKYEPILIIPPGSVQYAQSVLPGQIIMGSDFVKTNSPLNLTRAIIRKLCRERDLMFELWMRKKGIKISSHGFPMGKTSSVKNLCWIPDFQYLHYPNLFTADEIYHRNRGDGRRIMHSNGVIVSSQAAKRDLMNNYAGVNCNVHVLNFVPSLTEEGTSESRLREKYKLPESFAFLPNQFWAHKNHQVVIKAINRLCVVKSPVHVVCTGLTSDRRNPQYFGELTNLIESGQSRDFFHILGVIPYADIVGLMKMSSMVINPSLFEGWSTSVEEAKLLNKKLILSDIAVHREQNPDNAYYFDANSPESCADQMRACLSETRKNLPAATSDINFQIERFGIQFASLLDVAVKS